MNKILFLFSLILIFNSCEEENNRITNYPNISIINPNQEMYNIGQDIDINILISNDEVLDNILYLETCECTDDNLNSLELIELKNVFQNDWSYQKTISTNNIPMDVMCDYNIEITANDIKGNERSKSIYFHLMSMNEN